MVTELLPCPFCGKNSVSVGGLVPWVECELCGACGPPAAYEDQACEAWNTRATAAPVVVGEVTDEMICRFANVYYGRGKTYGPDRIRAALTAALARDTPTA